MGSSCQCVGSGPNQQSAYDQTQCSCGGSGSTARATSWFYDAKNAPLSHWDFDNTWVSQPNGFPLLRQ
jgi:hypothetical protein